MTIRVWDPLVRIGHWMLVLGIAIAWFTRAGRGAWHEWIGYAVLAVIVARVAWGWLGTAHARFAAFVCSPAVTLRYGRLVLAGREPRHVGHNPLGGWMIIALLVAAALAGFSGWLYTTDRFWGIEWVETLHATLADALLLLVAAHVAGVAFSSWRHRENLVAAMFHGRKRARGPEP
ncbi:MAG: cytochrome b/b6 domain-containing protein [Steroidobacteraceae bacterium]